MYTKQLFTPQSYEEGGTPKYRVTVLFDKENKEHMAFLKTLAADAVSVLKEHWPDEKTRPNLAFVGATHSNPVKDGDTAVNKEGKLYSEKDPVVKGHYFVGVSSKQKPAVVNTGNFPITEESEVYSGCWCEVAMNIYTYEMPRSRGVTIGLNGVRKRKDGERIGGGPPSVSDMFGDPIDGGDDPFAAKPEGTPAAKGDDPFGAM